VALLILGCCLGCSFLLGNLLKLCGELGGHEINGREVIQDGLENGKGVPDVHPLRPSQATLERCIQVLMPAEQEIFELSVLHQSIRCSVLLETDSESEIWPVTRSLSFLVVCAQTWLVFAWPALFSRLILVPSGQVSEDQLEESAEVLGLPDGAGEDERPQPVGVEESIVEGHELEIGRSRFMQHYDELVGILGVCWR
jgi:hypothetical protein